MMFLPSWLHNDKLGVACAKYNSIMQWDMSRIKLGCVSILMRCCL